MRIVFFGTPQFAVPSLEKLLQQSDIEVCGIVTQPDRRRGRGNKLIFSPVKQVAAQHNIKVWQPHRIKRDSQTLEELSQLLVDAFVVVAYGQIFSDQILQMPRWGCINLHGSLLPQYRGAAPIQWSLYNGDRTTGVTTMLMDRGMDTGAILLKTEIQVNLTDNFYEVAARLADVGADLLVKTLRQLSQNQIKPTPQNSDKATYAPLIQKSDYNLDWSKAAIYLHNQVRGFYPNCVTSFRGEKLKVMETVPIGEPYWQQLPAKYQDLKAQLDQMTIAKGKPGEIAALVKNWGPIVQTAAGQLLLEQVQLAGKRPQSGWDWVNGSHLVAGETLSMI